MKYDLGKNIKSPEETLRSAIRRLQGLVDYEESRRKMAQDTADSAKAKIDEYQTSIEEHERLLRQLETRSKTSVIRGGP